MGINVLHNNTPFQRLVFDKRLKLSKCPAVEIGTLFSVVSRPFANMGQPFQYNGIATVKTIDNSAADHMIQASHPSSFPFSKPFQYPFRGFRAFGLKGSTLSSELLSDMSCLFAAKFCSFACRCKIVYPQVNANDLPSRFWFGRFNGGGKDNVNVPGFFPLVITDSCRSRLLSCKQPALIITNKKIELFPSLDSRQGYLELTTILNQSEEACVQGQGLGTKLFRLAFGCGFDSAGHSWKDPDNMVSGEVFVTFPKRIIKFAVEFERISNVLINCYLKGGIARLRELKQSFPQRTSTFFVYFKFATHSLYEFYHKYFITNKRGDQGQFLHGLTPWYPWPKSNE